MEKVTGKVKWFNKKKGFGFIVGEKGDVFVHYTEIKMDGYKVLYDGDEVKYSLVNDNGNLVAKDVIPINSNNFKYRPKKYNNNRPKKYNK